MDENTTLSDNLILVISLKSEIKVADFIVEFETLDIGYLDATVLRWQRYF